MQPFIDYSSTYVYLSSTRCKDTKVVPVHLTDDVARDRRIWDVYLPTPCYASYHTTWRIASLLP